MYKTAISAIWIAALSSLFYSGVAVGYEHPGGFHTVGQINDVKTKVAAGIEPWASAYANLKATVDSSYARHAPSPVKVLCAAPYDQDSGGDGLIEDSRAAYLSALMYQLESDSARRTLYGETVRTILNAWATVNVDLRSAETTGEGAECGATPLVMTTAGTGLVLAAELISDYAPWSVGQRAAFKNWVRELLLKKAALLATYKVTNHRDWAFFATVAANHFLDDEGQTNPELTTMSYEIGQLRDWIDSRIINGPTLLGAMDNEIGRGADGLWYSYFALNALTSSLQVVYNATQTNLYIHNSSRVKSALDYLLYYCQYPGQWPHYTNADLRNCDSAWQGYAWPRNLFEAMGEIYGDPAFLGYVGAKSPILYPQAHHMGWQAPGLMRPSLDLPDGPGGSTPSGGPDPPVMLP